MVRSHGWDYLAALLALTTPVVFYINHHDYDIFAPEAAAFLIIFAAVGLMFGVIVNKGPVLLRTASLGLLLTLFIDVRFEEAIQYKGVLWGLVILSAIFAGLVVLAWVFRRHLTQILVAVFGTMIGAMFIFPPEEAFPGAFNKEKKQTLNKDLPLVIHLLLDEHIGTEGIPLSIVGGDKAKKRVKDFYANNDFKLFGKAYSQVGATEVSMTSMLNFLSDPTSDLLMPGTGIFRWQATENKAFDQLEAKGFQIKVYQTDWVNLCSSERTAVVACQTFRCCSLSNIEDLEIPITDKFRVIASVYLEPLISYRAIRKIYRKLSHMGMPIPVWDWERRYVSAFAGMNALDLLKADLSSAGPGQYYFVHLFLPHFPYVFDSKCKIQRAENWLARFSQKGLDVDRWGQKAPLLKPHGAATKNTPATRRLRYERYFDQLECLYTRLDAIFDDLRQKKLFDDAVIIAHGDHGSRLPITDPQPSQLKDITKADKVDTYSTLFAVKSPSISPDYDLRLLPINRLYKSMMSADFNSLKNDETLNATAPEKVFPQGTGFERRMPDFGEGSDFQP